MDLAAAPVVDLAEDLAAAEVTLAAAVAAAITLAVTIIKRKKPILKLKSWLRLG